MNGKETERAQIGHCSYPVRLPGFVSDEADVIKRVSYVFGIKLCGSCEHRAAALNRWAVFSLGAPRGIGHETYSCLHSIAARK